MSKVITKKQILDLIRDKKFSTEDELENYVVSKLPKLFGVKEDQIERQFHTTNFDGRCSNRADIIIRSDDGLKALLVIELKLSKSLEIYKDGDYEEPVKQLYKYAQDIRAPFGMLLTDIGCHVFENKFFFKGQKYKRVDGDNLPTIKEIEKKITFNCFIDFLLCKNSSKYAVLIILFYLFLLLSFRISNMFFGSMLSYLIVFLISLLIGSIIGLTLRHSKVLE